MSLTSLSICKFSLSPFSFPCDVFFEDIGLVVLYIVLQPEFCLLHPHFGVTRVPLSPVFFVNQ